MLVHARLAGVVDHDIGPGGQVQQPEAALLVGVAQPAPVRRRVQLPAVADAVFCEAFARSRTIGRVLPDFVFASSIDDGVNPALVVAEYRFARPRTFGNRDFHAALGAGAGQAHAPTRSEHQPLARGRQLDVGQLLQRRADLACALLVEVGHQVDCQRPVVRRCQVQHVHVGAQLVGDTAVAQRSVAHVPVLVARVLAQVGASGRHRPDVIGAIAVADEIQAALPPHRPFAIAGIGRQQLHRLGLAIDIVAPQLRVGAAPVILDVVVGERQAVAGEVQGLAGVVEHGVVGVGHGKHAARQRGGRDGRDDAVRRRSLAVLGADQHLALRGPAQHRHGAVLERDAPWQAASERHHVGFLRAFVGAGERHPAAVVRDGGVGFGGSVRGQALGRAALGAGLPQVAFGGEHHGVATDGRESVIGFGGVGADLGGQQANGQQQLRQAGQFHGDQVKLSD